MKYGKIYVTAAIFLFIGIFIFGIGFAMMGFNIMNFDTEPAYIEKSYSLDGNVSAIVVEEFDATINVLPSADKKINIKYYENGNKTYSIGKLADGSLSIKKNKASGFWNFFTFSVSTPILTIEIPEKYEGKLLIENQNGNTIAEGICMGSIKAEAENGFVRIYESNILGSLDVDAENGNIELYETKVGKTAKLSCENGRLFAQAVTASEIYTENENGFTALVDLTSKNTIFAESENGNIELSGVEFNVGATLITENGDIRGSVIGEESDFTFNCVSSRGKCNLENGVSQGAKQLNLRSENGDIEISFLSESDTKE